MADIRKTAFSQRSTEFYRFQIRMLDAIGHPVKLHRSQNF
jgi:hypothetical protein